MNGHFKNMKPAGIAALGVLGLCVALGVSAADHVVFMTASYTFNPSYLEIQVGDTVTWFNQDFEDHTSTSPGNWDTGDVPDGEFSPTFPFNGIGTFNYRCDYYWQLGMIGTIVVQAAPTPPPPARLSDLVRLPDGRFQFTLTNLTAGKTNVIQASTNLVNWTSLSTNVPSGSEMTFTDSSAPGFSRRFYRSFQVP